MRLSVDPSRESRVFDPAEETVRCQMGAGVGVVGEQTVSVTQLNLQHPGCRVFIDSDVSLHFYYFFIFHAVSKQDHFSSGCTGADFCNVYRDFVVQSDAD